MVRVQEEELKTRSTTGFFYALLRPKPYLVSRSVLHTSLASPRIWLPAVVLVSAMFLFGWKLNQAPNDPSWTIIYLLGTFLLVLLITPLTQKVTLDDRGIHYRSLLIKSSIAWDDVACWGAYRSRRHGMESVRAKDVQKSVSRYGLYISAEPKADRRTVSIVTPVLINVGYRTWIKEELVKRLGEDALLQ